MKYIRIRNSRSTLKGRKEYNSELFNPVDKKVEKKHIQLWSKIHHSVDLNFLRVYSNYSGIYTPDYIPEDLYRAIVERILNDANTANYDMDKNRLDLILGKENCPQVYLKNINGDFLNQNSENITLKEAKFIFSTLDSDIIIKPSVYSFQGSNVRRFNYVGNQFIDRYNNPVDFGFLYKMYMSNFIVQACIKQHPSTAKFNPDSVNCIRVYTYRSVKTENFHILNMFFKAGRKGVIVDNTLPGGLWTHITPEGRLGAFAYTRKHQKFYVHPDSKLTLKDQEIPFMDRVRKLAFFTANKFYNHRVLGIDIAINENGRPLVLEVNILGISCSQQVGGPFFGTFTEEVVEFCSSHLHLDNYKAMSI